MGAPNLFDRVWDFEGSSEEGGSTNDLPEVAEQVETGLTVVLTSEYTPL